MKQYVIETVCRTHQRSFLLTDVFTAVVAYIPSCSITASYLQELLFSKVFCTDRFCSLYAIRPCTHKRDPYVQILKGSVTSFFLLFSPIIQYNLK